MHFGAMVADWGRSAWSLDPGFVPDGGGVLPEPVTVVGCWAYDNSPMTAR